MSETFCSDIFLTEILFYNIIFNIPNVLGNTLRILKQESLCVNIDAFPKYQQWSENNYTSGMTFELQTHFSNSLLNIAICISYNHFTLNTFKTKLFTYNATYTFSILSECSPPWPRNLKDIFPFS